MKTNGEISPSVDNVGRITYIPKAKGYKAAQDNLIGSRVQIITCLNTSETIQFKRNGHNAKKLITRVYSLKSNGRSGKLLGHASRFILSDVKPVIWQEGQNIVRLKHSKTPHAWLSGVVSEILDPLDYMRHHEVLSHSSGQYVAYDPYKSDNFVWLINSSFI